MTREPVDSTAELPILESADALEAVPGFTLIRMLTETTLARVYECRYERTGEITVVKVLAKDFTADRVAVQRVLRENRVIAGLRSHPNIARVIDVGEAAAGPYVAFEKIAGTDLRSRLNQGSRIPVADALAAVRDAAKAIEAAAAVGVAHRDVKPSNLFVLANGSVKLTDFGFAAPLARLGGPEGVYGTPSFIAPELIKGAPADVRTDIYALGATLFQLVTARPLFEGATPDVLMAHQKKPVPSIATLVPDAGIAVVDILYRLLHKDPARRPQTATDVVKLLDDALVRARRTSTADNLPAASEPQWPTMQPTIPMPRPSLAATPVKQERAPEKPPPSPFDAPASDSGDAYRAQPTGVLGTLKQMSVSEIVQMLEIGKKSARVEVSDMQNTKGVLHVHDGQLVHATFGNDVGEAAVVAMCVRKEGYFRIHYDKEKCERNITRPTTFVLLEAMRVIDETGSQPPAPAPAPAAVPKPSPRLPTPLARPLPSLAKPMAQPASTPASVAPPGSVAPGASGGFADQPVTLPEADVPVRPGASPNPIAGLGDGIQFDSSGSLPAVHSVDDVTLRETPTAIGKSPLERVMSEARALWLRSEPALVRGWGDAKRIIGAAFKAAVTTATAKTEPLRPQLARVHPKLGQVSPLAVVAGAVAVVVLLVVVVANVARAPKATLGYDDALRLILRGKSNAVVGALGNVAPSARSAWQTLALADASAVLHDDDRAIGLYSSALPQGAVDPLELGFLASRLDASAPDDEMDLLVLWPDRDVEDVLQPMTLDVRASVRANAVAVLVERGALSRINVEQVAILDLLPREGTCASRTTAMRALAAAGRTKGALDVVDRVGHAQDTCFQSGELSAAYKAIKKRL